VFLFSFIIIGYLYILFNEIKCQIRACEQNRIMAYRTWVYNIFSFLKLAAFWFTCSSSGFLCNWKIGHSWKKRPCVEESQLRYRLPLSGFVYKRSFYIVYYYLVFFLQHKLIQDHLKLYTLSFVWAPFSCFPVSCV